MMTKVEAIHVDILRTRLSSTIAKLESGEIDVVMIMHPGDELAGYLVSRDFLVSAVAAVDDYEDNE